MNVIDNVKMQVNLPLDDRSVKKTIAERDEISTTIRYLGMLVYVEEDKKLYILKNGITNEDWEELTPTIHAKDIVYDEDFSSVSKSEKNSWTSKAEGSHTHTKDDITAFPEYLPNPNSLTIKLNGNLSVEYTGAEVKELNITTSSIGAQPAGNYALTDHLHDDRYYTEEEINTKLSTYQPKGNYSAEGHTHDDRYLTETEINNKLSGYQPIGSYAVANHTHSNYLANNTSGTINGNLTVTGEVLSNGNVTAFSDIRVKKNIVPLDDSIIEKLKKINLYNYEMKNDPTNRKRVGVIAQELEELFPELVFTNKDGIKSVDYIGLNTYFSFVIQKLLEKICKCSN